VDWKLQFGETPEEMSMIEMSGADAYFLREESRARHMHTLKIVVVEPEGAHDPPSLERVRAGAVGVLPREPAFRRRLLDVPAGLGNPFWVDAHKLDPYYHVRHEVLPEGSTDDALDVLAGRIASEPLDRARPLWQIFFVEGLPGGRVAYVSKIHHAVADGVASAELVLRMLQEKPDRVTYSPWEPPPEESLPSRGDRIWAATKLHARRQRELPALVWRSMREIGTSLSWRRSGRAMPVRMFNAPAARFNQPITPNRVYAHIRLPLAQIIEIKRRAECTVNDVFLSLVGGTVHHYLAAHGERNDAALTAAIPVSVRSNLDDPAFGNALAYSFATTASHIADPVDRLRAVGESTRAARALLERRDPRLAVDWLDHWVLRKLYLHDMPIFLNALLGRPGVNLIASNVRGPSVPLYSNGARVSELFSMGPLSGQQGLNFTGWSYLDDFTVGLHACREQVPDVQLLAAGLATELESLRKELDRK
jgi:WS/DGAT/MGAT family acyltransferase